jgi:3-O-methylgallate 3,4-dioxygenase
MLLVDAEDLSRYEENDRRIGELLDRNGARTTFDILLAEAADRHLAVLSPESLSARHQAGRQGIAALADALASADLDAVIVIGDDQHEMIKDESIPPLMVYTAPAIRSQRPPQPANRPEWVLKGSNRYYPATATDYPVAQPLAKHLAASLKAQGFGVTAAETKAKGAPMGHAFAFVETQLMRGSPVPVVPVLLNALYPPNQPTPQQCLEIGEAIAKAIDKYPEDARIGIVASGGLSHFVIDEELDRGVIKALTEKDEAALAAVPLNKLNSGSAEIRNWICAAGALKSLQIEHIDYIPGYRTKAGTGTGLCFAIWR